MGLIDFSSLGTCRNSKRPPVASTSSGQPLESPPAPMSWMERMGFAAPSDAHASMTPWQRRCISALPRWTELKSRSSEFVPVIIEDAAPPPKPMRMAGPPIWTMRAPGVTGFFSIWLSRMTPMPPASMMGLW